VHLHPEVDPAVALVRPEKSDPATEKLATVGRLERVVEHGGKGVAGMEENEMFFCIFAFFVRRTRGEGSCWNGRK
jgi:hypothetical protein